MRHGLETPIQALHPGLPVASLNGDRCAVELGEGKAAKNFVERGSLILEDADGDRFTEQSSDLSNALFSFIRSP